MSTTETGHSRASACRPTADVKATPPANATVAVHSHRPMRPDMIALGIIGGGQLARMMAQAATQFGCEAAILERLPEFPARSMAARALVGDWDDSEVLRQLGAVADVVTLENEFVSSDALEALERHGHKLWPSSSTMRLVQDKLIQKQTLVDAGLAVPRFADAPDRAAVTAAGARFGWPLVLKRRKLGYDGKGNATLHCAADLDGAWRQLDGDRHPLYVEEFCRFSMELAVIVTRGQGGDTAVYPVTETINRDHICHVTRTPAPVSLQIGGMAQEMARRVAVAIRMVGSMGLELFLREDGVLLVNEIAPRVHNTGHYTIEACACSQFENHVRAVLGWPLGSPALRAPAAVMVNLLANAEGSGAPQGLAEALRVSGAHVHLYGKTRASKGRKMGHVTALGCALEEAMATARAAADHIRFE